MSDNVRLSDKVLNLKSPDFHLMKYKTGRSEQQF